MKLVLATHNQGKLEELRAILEAQVPGLELVSYDGPEPVEDGLSFLENAMIKAKAAFLHTGLPSIADDSGLAVEVLGGSPGIFTAIWAGGRDNVANRRLLLAQLKDIAPEHRAAAFVCTLALVGPNGEASFTGIWSGSIDSEERGTNGHGYDPVFIPEGFSVTAAELEPELKNAYSHRAQALAQLSSFLTAQGANNL
jgi:XTP/dITP diphosphohydrolase